MSTRSSVVAQKPPAPVLSAGHDGILQQNGHHLRQKKYKNCAEGETKNRVLQDDAKTAPALTLSSYAIDEKYSSSNLQENGMGKSPMTTNDRTAMNGGQAEANSKNEVVSHMEAAFGVSFAGVQLRTDEQAARKAAILNAVAFMDDQGIGFARGAFAPNTRNGMFTIAHEFAHVVQARGGSGQRRFPTLSLTSSKPRRQSDDNVPRDAVEADADAAAEAVLRGENPELMPATLSIATMSPAEQLRLPVPANSYRVDVVGGTFWYFFNPADFNNLSDKEKAESVYRKHFSNVYPSAGSDLASDCLKYIDSHTKRGLEWHAKEKGKVLPVKIEAALQKMIVDWMSANHREIRQSSPALATHVAGDGGTGAGAGQGAGAKKGPGQTSGSQSASGSTTPQAPQESQQVVNSRVVTITPALPPEKLKKILSVLQDILGPVDPNKPQPTTPPIGISEKAAEFLLQIDSDPQRAEIIESLKKTSVENRSKGELENVLDSAIANANIKASAAALQFDMPEGSAQEPVEHRPVHGTIVNRDQSGPLVQDKKAEFYFQVWDDRDALRVPHIAIKWFAYPKDNPSKHVAEEVTNYIPLRPQSLLDDRIFDFTPKETGILMVEAFVNYNFFEPNHFVSTPSLVVTQAERIASLKTEAMKDFAQPGKTQSYNYVVGGLTGVQTGEVTTGQLDPHVTIKKLEDRLKLATDQEEQVKELIKSYEKRTSDEDQAVLKWAKKYLETLEESRGKLEQDKGATPLAVRGAYASRTRGVPSKTLDLLCYFRRPGSDYHLSLFDFTQVFEEQDYRFQADSGRVREAEERVFLDQADSYPPGTLSVTFQIWDEGKQAGTDQYIQFTKVTDTVGKKIKSVVFDEVADVIVNLAAVIMMVIPGLQLLGLALAIAYNTAKTVSELEDSHTKGTLTNAQLAIGIGSIALNLIPLAGRGAKIITIAGKAWHVADAVVVGGNVLLVTEEGLTEVDKLRGGVIKTLAEKETEIRKKEEINSADPSLIDLKAERDGLKKKAVDATWDTFGRIIAQQFVMVVGQHLVSEYASRRFSVGELKNMGRFTNERDVVPHYDFEKSQIVADETKISPAKLEELQHQDLLNESLKPVVKDAATRQEVTKALGNATVEVKGGAPATKLERQGDKLVLNVADGASTTDLVTEANKASTLEPKKAAPEPPPQRKSVAREFKPVQAAAEEERFGPAGKGEAQTGEPARAKGLPELEDLPKSELQPATTVEGEAQAEAVLDLTREAELAYEDARKSKYAGEFGKQEFIDKYRQGEVFDQQTRRWKNREGPARRPPEFFAAGTSVDTAFDRLASDKSTSSFKDYFKTLERLKIATKEKIQADLGEALSGMSPDERVSVDKVRHGLKQKYRSDLVRAMTEAPDGTKLSPKASHEALLDVTKDLAPADKGSLAEEWVQKMREAAAPGDAKVKEAPKQVEVKKADHPALTQDRRLDRIEGETVNEIKSTDSYLSADDKAQITDNLNLVGEQGAEINVNGKSVTVKTVKVTLTSPVGARKNADYLVGRLRTATSLEVEVFNTAHESQKFTSTEVAADNGAKFYEFLGIRKK